MRESRRLIAGKLPGDILQRLLATYVESDSSVLVGPDVGADAAAIAPAAPIVIVKSDPITFPTPDIAGYLVNVNANDIVCMGGTPRWMLVTALLPDRGTTEAMVETIFQRLSSACRDLNIALVGGHTEITDAVTRPVLIGSLLGEASQEGLLDLRRCRAGDRLLLCNSVAIEGTAILASEAPPALLAGLDPSTLDRARRLTDDSGISVVPAARALIDSGAAIRGMHDPTEGGVATAIREVGRISDCDIALDRPIPVREDTSEICARLDLNPLGLIASGALLAVVAPGGASAAGATMRDSGFEVVEIGRLAERTEDTPQVWQSDGTPLPEFETDEIARFFSGL